MKDHRGTGERIFDVVNIAMLSLLCLVCTYPLLYVAFSSFSDANGLMQHQGLLYYPIGFSLEAYTRVFSNSLIASGYRNTLFVLVVATSLNLIMTAFGAYGLSRKRVKLSKPILLMIVFTMFFNGGLIPTFLVVQKLNLVNSLAALIIPTAVNAFNLIVMRTFFLSLPDSLEESAKIDGAQDFTVLFRIILPLSMPVLAVITLFYAVSHWNGYFQALIYINDRDLFPLQLVLREILVQNSTQTMALAETSLDTYAIAETIKYATIMVATIPILFIYPFLQRYFVKGVMIGAIKG